MNSFTVALISIGFMLIYLFIGSIISGIIDNDCFDPITVAFWPLFPFVVLLAVLLDVGSKIGGDIRREFRIWNYKRKVRKNERSENC